MRVFGGAPAEKPGCLSNDTWTLALDTLEWKSMDPHTGPTPSGSVPAAAYDPGSRDVLVHDTQALYRYQYETNTYALLSGDPQGAQTDYHLTAVVDPGRKLFVMIGGNQVRAFGIDGADFAMKTWDSSVTGCDALKSAPYPGLAYHPGLARIVGWAGGDTIYLFDPDTKACETRTYPGGPAAQQNGTNGRFRYFPAQDRFVLVADADEDVYTLKL